jgi:hypothetical protein
MLIVSGLATLNHMLLPVYGDPAALSIGWTGFSLYALVVLAIPFRRGERWAWYSTWIQVIGFSAPILVIRGEGIAVVYLVIGGVMALCLLLTRPTFFRKHE